MAQAVTTDEFKKTVLDSDQLVVVDFWAAWCAPCRALSPILEQLADEFDGKAKVVKLNVDENPKTSGEYGITGIPNVKFFKNGKVVEDIIGLAPKPHYQALIKNHLSDDSSEDED